MRWRERGAAKPVPIVIGVLVGLVVVLLIANLIVRPHSSTSNVGGPQYSTTAGPEAGVDAKAYISQRKAALGTVTANPSWAVVSFTSYETVAGVKAAAGGMTLGGLLVAAAGGYPATIAPGDVGSWVSTTRSQANSDAAGIRQMLPTTGDPQTAAEFRADLARLAVVAKVSGSQPIVFGAVIRAAPEVLKNLAGSAEVRLVDPIGATLPDLQSIAGLRPEETGVTRSPPTRPTA